jgi:hypothetical protein
MYLDRLILLYTSFLVGLVTVTEDEPLLSPPSLSLCWELEMEMDTVILHFSYSKDKKKKKPIWLTSRHRILCFLPFDVGQEKLQYHCGI